VTAPTLPAAPPAGPQARVLRDYQVEAADAVVDGWQRGVEGPAVVLPTGSGKTSVIAELARREVAVGGRVLMLAHRNELIEQMADAVAAVDPHGPAAEMIGGPHRGDAGAKIVSATVQSLQRPATLARLGHRDLLIVDEAHHAVARTYLNVITHFHTMGSRRTGFTATMTRLAPTDDEPPLRDVWGEVVFERDVTWAIEKGFLLAPYGVTVTLPDLDVASLHTGAGEITDDEASAAMMQETTLNATVAAVVDRTKGLSTIVFGSSMDHCHQLAAALVRLGVPAEVVVGPTSSRDRRGIYRRFHSGQTRVLVTVDVLTEGADFPRCEAVVLARPTRSQSRLVQCVGRGLRPHVFADGRVKERALVVDLVGAGSLGLIVQTELDRTPSEDSRTSTVCEDCGEQPCACGGDGNVADEDPLVVCTCSCGTTAFGICRCGCGCDVHRVDALVDFDPITGERSVIPPRRGDSPWSQRTATIRWSRHPRGLVRPIYRSNGSKGVLMLADMRGVPGTTPGQDWAFGFFDSSVRLMFWVGTDGQWHQPGPDCYLQGLSLRQADETAQAIFGGHMRDVDRTAGSPAQVQYATRMGIPNAGELDRRDLGDLLAVAQADHWLPRFDRPDVHIAGTAA
jgi:superfamily II DNA or RNA helicase